MLTAATALSQLRRNMTDIVACQILYFSDGRYILNGIMAGCS